MGVAVIIERIRSSVSAGALIEVPDAAKQLQVSTMADLLRPWEEVFFGVPRPDPDDDASPHSIYGNGGLRNPRFIPRPRLSLRPPAPPQKIAPPAGRITDGLFAAVHGIWAWYQAEGKATPELLAQPFDEEGFYSFVDPLLQVSYAYWPMCCPLETLFEEVSIRELSGIHLMIPHYHHEDEAAGVVEAFLTGSHGIGWLMAYYHKNEELTLSPRNEALIKEVGFERLVEAYMLFPGKKSVDLLRLENVEDTFFAEVVQRFPLQWRNDGNYWPIISGNYGEDCEVWIRSKEDLDFIMAYAKAYYKMMAAMPSPCDFEENLDGVASDFAKELCKVWRKVGNHLFVGPPAPKLLVNVLREEQA